MKWIACSLFLLSGIVAQGQVHERVRVLLLEDTTTPPKYDTSYVKSYRNNVVVSLVTAYADASIDLSDTNGHELAYTTNNAERYGFGLNYKWLSAEFTFGVPLLDAPDPALGKTTSRGFGLGMTGRRIWARLGWSEHSGFYLENTREIVPGSDGTDPLIVRRDLEDRHFVGTFDYAFNFKRRYSQNATLYQMERQKRSAGTLIAGASIWNTRIRADSSLVPFALLDTFPSEARFTELRRWIVGTNIGYTHTFSFWKKGFINAAVVPGFSVQFLRLQSAEGVGTDHTTPGGSLAIRMGAGFNGDRWYTALTMNVLVHSGMASEAVQLSLMQAWARFAIGIRFPGPNWHRLERWGL
ncbi:MAG: DUF4421 family protein [Flavobacteriales bacterium]|nr:DUF4421 family protein [Flavobacteriales bacterium]